MNDDFEKKLQRQSFRPIPGDWRKDILRNARTNAPAADPKPSGLLLRAGLTVWRELLWPCRYAWSGLLAIWIALALFNTGSGTSTRPLAGHSSAPVRAQFFEEQRRVLAELTGPDRPAMEPPVSLKPRPRSDRSGLLRIG
jgi:hypothetical protein